MCRNICLTAEHFIKFLVSQSVESVIIFCGYSLFIGEETCGLSLHV